MKSVKLWLLISVVIIHAIFGMEEAEQTRDSATYDSHLSPEFNRAMKTIKKALKERPIPEDAYIIDIGCGRGDVTAQLATMVPRGIVIGIDISKRNIMYANKNHKPSLHNNLFFTQNSAQELLDSKSDKAMYDLALLTSVLHFIPSEEQFEVLKGIYQMLKPGGRLIVQVGERAVKAPNYRAIVETVKKPDWLTTLAGSTASVEMIVESINARVKDYPTRDELQKLINEVGFEGEVSIYDDAYPMKNKAALMAYFKGPFSGYPSFARMDKNKQDVLTEEITDRYMEMTGMTYDKLEFRFPLLIAIAIKPEQSIAI